MKVKYTRKGINFKTKSLGDALLVSECLHTESAMERIVQVNKIEKDSITTINKSIDLLSWHFLTTKTREPLHEQLAFHALKGWGFSIEQNSIQAVQSVLSNKRKKISWDILPLSDIKQSAQYSRAEELVLNEFAHLLNFYQVEGAAFMIAKKRLLLGFDTGLGKTRTTLAGLSADPAIELLTT